MTLQTRKIEYTENETLLEGYLAWDDSHSGPRPGILVAHAWGGRDDFACKKAEEMAALGYVGFALDMFGKGVLGHSVEENQKLITPFVQDRSAMQSRMQKALEVMQAQDEVNADQVGAIGFCFGGMCVLDLARTGADMAGVVSMHGLLGAPDNLPEPKILAKVLVLHGYQDTMAKPEDLHAIQKELDASGSDWQTHCYGQAYHAFTNPEANDHELGTVYNETAAKRALMTLTGFLNETFSA
jgi:dienelactone hydrolase